MPKGIPNSAVYQDLNLPILLEKKVSLSIKRDDLNHPLISGNKLRKLKYNVLAAKAGGYKTILTFGGAYSNHIAATAQAGRIHNFKTIGIIRGEELALSWQKNVTLKKASEMGMKLKFISRTEYRDRENPQYLKKLQEEFGVFYLLPEGGTNQLAIQGCEEILSETDAQFDFITCAMGTGGTLAGLINASTSEQIVLGFPALKGQFLYEDIRKFVTKSNWRLIYDYHFGGYAKCNSTLVNFINDFRDQTSIPLDPIYTGKMLYGLLDLIKNDYFEQQTKILAIHTGGLQGIAGMNRRLKKNNLPLLNV